MNKEKILLNKIRDDILNEPNIDFEKEQEKKSKQVAKIVDKFIFKTLKKLGYKGLLTEKIKLEKFIDKNKIEICYREEPIIVEVLKDRVVVSVLIIYNILLLREKIDYKEEFFI